MSALYETSCPIRSYSLCVQGPGLLKRVSHGHALVHPTNFHLDIAFALEDLEVVTHQELLVYHEHHRHIASVKVVDICVPDDIYCCLHVASYCPIHGHTMYTYHVIDYSFRLSIYLSLLAFICIYIKYPYRMSESEPCKISPKSFKCVLNSFACHEPKCGSASRYCHTSALPLFSMKLPCVLFTNCRMISKA